MPPRTRPATSDHLSKASSDSERFTWESSDGSVSVDLPEMKSLSTKLLRENRNRDDADFMFTLLETLLPSKVLAQVDELPVSETNNLFQEWQKTGTVTFPQS